MVEHEERMKQVEQADKDNTLIFVFEGCVHTVHARRRCFVIDSITEQ